MDSVEAADASGDAISTITSLFMMDMDTYAHGGELGFDGVDFYISGRGGVLGDAPASVVVAAFGFWTPQVIVKGWEQSAGVMPRRQAAEEFAGVSHRWAEAHVPDGIEATSFHALPAEAWDRLATEARDLLEHLSARDPHVYRRYARWWSALPSAEVRILPRAPCGDPP